MFWDLAPTDEERAACVERVGADLLRLYPYDSVEEVWCDDYMVGRAAPDRPRSGLLVEVVHYSSEFMDRTLSSVPEGFDRDLGKQNLVAGVLESVPLHGRDRVRQWQMRASEYPEELAVAVVKGHATIDHFWRWEMWLYRGENLLMLYQAFSQVAQQLLHILLGLNRVYYFGFKWLDVVTARLLIAPPDFAGRLKRVFQIAPRDGAHELAALVEETYDLVEQHLPQIDVVWLRQVFRYRRPLWEHLPSS